MIGHAIAYMVGTSIGELALFGKWAMSQDPGKGLLAYVAAKRGSIILSLCVALVACLAWAEGTLVKKLGWDVEFTLGVSVIAGAAFAFFSHSIIAILGKRIDPEAPKE